MERSRSLYTVVTLILVAAMSGCATNKVCPGAGCTADDATVAAVTAAISAHADLGPPNQIQIASINHVVYLSGLVDSGLQRSIAEHVAASTDGVDKVVNTISVSR